MVFLMSLLLLYYLIGTSPATLIRLKTGSSLVLPPTAQLPGVGIFQLLDLLPPAHPIGFGPIGEKRETEPWSSCRFAGDEGLCSSNPYVGPRVEFAIEAVV